VANLPDQASLDAEVDAKITTHNSATTSVHGIANTANLVLTSDSRLSDTRDPKAHTHTKSNITDFTHTHAVADVTGLQTALDGKALLSHAHAIADVTGLQTAIDNSGIKAGVQWTDRHTTSTGNQYAVGSIVYNAGRVFRCLATNDSITPAVGGNAYWADLGAGYLLPNENPKIQGGTIEISGGASIVLKSGTSGDADGGNGGAILQVGGNSANGSVQTGEDENGDPIYEDIDQVGGNAGYIWQNGATGGDYGAGGSAGYIDTSAYQGNSGGNINTSNGGGAIDTRGTGSIQLGVTGARTTLNGSASGGNKTITLPNATGTIALTSDSRFTDPRTPTTHSHGVIGNTGELNGGTIIQLNIIVNNIPNGTWPVLQALHPNWPDLSKNSSAQVQVSGTSPNKTLTILNGGVGYNATQSVTIAGVVGSITGCNSYDKPLISNSLGYVSAGSFGTTLYSFCQGNDPRLSDNRTPTSHTHGNITNAGAIGSTSNLPLITTTAGAITTGSFGTTANSFCQGDDSRLSNSRTPTAHTHDERYYTETEMDTFLNGKQPSGSYAPASGIAPSAITGTAVVTNDARLSDPRTPTAHKSTHATGGTDALTPADIGAQPSGTYATLVSGKVPSDQLPSFVDDVLEYANNSAFPATGEAGKIYVSLATNKTFRWSGSAYIEISPSEVTSINTKTGAVTLTASDVGACASNDARLSDNRTPTAHKSSHATGGTDALTPTDIGAVAASSYQLLRPYPATQDTTLGLNGNTAGGRSALIGVTTGTDNTAFGAQALLSNTVGLNNTASGANALYSNTTGNHNTASGANALYSNTTGTANVANGEDALKANTTGIGNTAVGRDALLRNTTANFNTCIGYQALLVNTTGGSNTASGQGALQGNTTGSSNTASGTQALLSNTTGGSNSAFGQGSLASNTTASANTAVGQQALNQNTTGGNNTASGLQALFSNTTGGNNTASGLQALFSNTTGGNNTAVGAYAIFNGTNEANTGVGTYSLFANTGAHNAGFGYQAGGSIVAGSGNTIVGSGADVDSGPRSLCLVLGRGAVSPAVNGSLAIGGTGGNAMNGLTTTIVPTGATGTWLRIWLNGLEYRIPIQRAS
jgi:hypothetical protein